MGRKRKANSEPPQIEKDLLELQAKFFEDRDNREVRDAFFCLLKQYSRSVALQIVQEQVRKGKPMYLPPSKVDEVSTEAALKTFEKYKKSPNWKVKNSFHGHLYYKCKEAMFSGKNEEGNTSLNIKLSEDSSREIADLLSESQGILPWDLREKATDPYDPVENLVREMNAAPEEIQELLDEAYDTLPYKTYVVFLCWFLIRLRKPRTRNLSENFKKKWLMDSREEEVFDYLLKSMKDRLELHE